MNADWLGSIVRHLLKGLGGINNKKKDSVIAFTMLVCVSDSSCTVLFLFDALKPILLTKLSALFDYFGNVTCSLTKCLKKICQPEVGGDTSEGSALSLLVHFH